MARAKSTAGGSGGRDAEGETTRLRGAEGTSVLEDDLHDPVVLDDADDYLMDDLEVEDAPDAVGADADQAADADARRAGRRGGPRRRSSTSTRPLQTRWTTPRRWSGRCGASTRTPATAPSATG